MGFYLLGFVPSYNCYEKLNVRPPYEFNIFLYHVLICVAYATFYGHK